MEKEPFSFKKRAKSFRYAFQGIIYFLKTEHNGRIHVFAAVLAIIWSFLYDISSTEWIVVILSIAMVFGFELINSAIEKVADFVSPDKHEAIKRIKDMAAGAVLVSAIGAFIIGLIIFIPKMFG